VRANESVNYTLEQVPGIDIRVAHSSKPLRVPLNFATPFGYMGAYLIADYDALVRAVFTANKLGLLQHTFTRPLLERHARAIRHAFGLVRCWKYCGVTRHDIRQNNQRAQNARATMGELPAVFLDRSKRPPHAPRIRSTWAGVR
jgi:integrating conjugative element protein (TIGR03761 family)